MRFFCFSFVVYLVVLFVQPCPDLTASTNCNDSRNTAISFCSPASDNGTEAEECSPFCGCSCSGNPIEVSIVEFAIGPYDETQITDANFAEYSSPHITTYQNLIWQPPKSSI